MNRILRALFPRVDADIGAVARINALRGRSDLQLREVYRKAESVEETIAVASVVAERVLGERMFDVQLRGALALARGSIAEMQTGEGKTLTAVPAALWFARSGNGVHVMTVNDYLARRDSEWMGPVYSALGISCGSIRQGLTADERRAAYSCDITYATANEVGFDYLRDQLALRPDDRVQRPFAAAIVDEADSILLDEARIPLVIAGGDEGEEWLSIRADRVVRGLARGCIFGLRRISGM